MDLLSGFFQIHLKLKGDWINQNHAPLGFGNHGGKLDVQ